MNLRRWLPRAALALISAEIALHVLWPHMDDNDPVPALELQLGFVAAILPFLLPHVLAWMASRGRRSLLLPAGILGVVVTFFSAISPFLLMATLPLLLLPSIVYLVRWAIGAKHELSGTPGLTLLLVLAGTGSLLMLLATQDARCYGDSCTSDVIAFHESIISLCLWTFVVSMGWRYGDRGGFPDVAAVSRELGPKS